MTENMQKMVDLLKRVDAECRKQSRIWQTKIRLERAERAYQKYANAHFQAKLDLAKQEHANACAVPSQYSGGWDPLVATILYATRAHCRKRIHMHWWKKYENGRPILTLDNQLSWIKYQLSQMDASEGYAWMKGRSAAINKEERTLLLQLLDSPPPIPFAEKLASATQ